MKKNWIFVIFSLFILADVLLAFWIGGLILADSSSDSISAQEKVDYVIVLGCGLKEDKPDRILKSRLETAVEFLEKYPDSVAICTGGQGADEPIPEATAMEKYLLKAGISKDRVKKETTSANTYENFKHAKKLITKFGDDPKTVRIAIVTSEFHLYRSAMLAEGQGFVDSIKVSAKTPALWFYPHFLREIAAVVKAWLFYL